MMITYQNKKCTYCSKSVPLGVLFCNQCQSPKMAYLDISIAPSWSKYVDTRRTEREKIEELIKYSERHGYRFDLVRLKLFLKFNVIVEVSKQNMHLLPDLSGGIDDTDY